MTFKNAEFAKNKSTLMQRQYLVMLYFTACIKNPISFLGDAFPIKPLSRVHFVLLEEKFGVYLKWILAVEETQNK